MSKMRIVPALVITCNGGWRGPQRDYPEQANARWSARGGLFIRREQPTPTKGQDSPSAEG